MPSRIPSLRPRLLLLALLPALAAQGHDDLPQTERWLAGDHHVHSRFSVGWDRSMEPPAPVMGGDATYPIPMNAVMGRRHGLDWMVTTDHGGPNHARIHRDHAYPELQESRRAVPEVIQFYGMEFNTPGADHSSIILPHSHDEADHLHSIESRFDSLEAWPEDPARNSEARMIEALRALDELPKAPVLIAHHPSRSATGLGEYGMTEPKELRAWNDAAPHIAVGMEGAPGHQAIAQVAEGLGPSNHAKYFGDARPRGFYRGYPTLGGYDQMTARLGGFWDAMLGEGRRWWITATSDSHIHWRDGGGDFWPGEYSKTYILAAKDHDAILESLRAGRVFVTTGDLISELWVSARGGEAEAGIGGTLRVPAGEAVTVTIKFLDPDGTNHNGDNPVVERVDLIVGEVRGKVADASTDSNPSTRVVARFTDRDWRRDGDHRVITHTLEAVDKPLYLRVRGTNTDELEPQPDPDGENPWGDLWFYSNPIFVESR